jgi:chemotaxis protein methyltransferase CheR
VIPNDPVSAPPHALRLLIDRLGRWTGLDLGRGAAHAALVRYLRRRVDHADPQALARYVDGLVTPQHPEVVRLVDAITVCYSTFYRDPDQLAAAGAVLREAPGQPASIWVPGCATGEEAYSIALVAEAAGRRAAILATDINARALAHAARGAYGAWSVRELPPAFALARRADGLYEVPERLRRAVTFEQHNLMDPLPGRAGGWDVILCRNVLMYLDRGRARELVGRLAAALRPGGHLFLGANDILDHVPAPLRFVRVEGRHVLQRAPDPAGAQAPAVARTRSDVPAPAVARTQTDLPIPAVAGTGTDVVISPAESSPALPSPAVSDALARSLALLDRGDVAGALALLHALLDADPLCVDARLLAGIAHHLGGDAPAAADKLRGALLLAPALWPAEMYLGFALAKLGDGPGAARAARRAGTLAAAPGRAPLSPLLAAWLEPWRVDAIAMAPAP